MGIIQRQGIRNSIITYVGFALGAVSLIIIQPRFLSKEEIGLTRVLFSFSALVSNLVPLGMTAAVLKFFPYFRNRDEKHYGFFGFMFILPLFGFALLGSLLFLFKGTVMARYVEQSKLFTDYFYYVFPLTFFLSFTSLLTAYSFSIFRTSVPALVNDILVRIGGIILFTLYFIKFLDRDQFILLFVGIYGLQLATLFVYLLYEDNPSFIIRWSQFSEHTPLRIFTYSVFMSLTGITSLGLRYMDSLMLGTYKPTQTSLNALDVVGIYSIAAFVATFVEAPMNALEKIVVPKMADGWKKNDLKDIQDIYYKSSKYLFLLGGLLFLLINLNVDSLFQMIPDKDYSLAKGVVFIISLGTLINMATGNNESIIYTSSRYKILPWMLVVLVAVAYANYRIFIPLFGMEGAAIATALSSLLFNLSKFVVIWRYFHMQPFTIDTAKIAATIVLTGIIIYLTPSFQQPVISIAIRSVLISSLFGALVYFLNIIPEFYHLIPFLKKKD